MSARSLRGRTRDVPKVAPPQKKVSFKRFKAGVTEIGDQLFVLVGEGESLDAMSLLGPVATEQAQEALRALGPGHVDVTITFEGERWHTTR